MKYNFRDEVDTIIYSARFSSGQSLININVDATPKASLDILFYRAIFGTPKLTGTA